MREEERTRRYETMAKKTASLQSSQGASGHQRFTIDIENTQANRFAHSTGNPLQSTHPKVLFPCVSIAQAPALIATVSTIHNQPVPTAQAIQSSGKSTLAPRAVRRASTGEIQMRMAER
jgi:hypothetical protein